MPAWLKARLRELATTGRRRSLRSLQSRQGAHIVIEGKRLINFSSNDTLGLAGSEILAQAAQGALDERGLGAGAARLLAGNFDIASQLETEVADWLGAEAALVFSSGYHANVGVLSCLGTSGTRLFSDAQNHASIIDGARLSRSERTVYPHFQPPLATLQAGDLVVTESVFSMEGVAIPACWIADVQATGAHAVVDEAHAIGWAGEQGEGLATPDTFCRVGTFGKALGGFGAFVTGSTDLIELLKSDARSFIFTTALPAPVLAANLAAVRYVRSQAGADVRGKLERNINLVVRDLGGELEGHGPIFSLRVGKASAALERSRKLEKRGLLVQAVRPPTVPEGGSMLRLVVSASHSSEDIGQLADALRKTSAT